MIELTPLARPYAKALFASAIESNTLEDMAVELNTMAVASIEDGVINTIENPTLSRQEIVDILVKLFDDSISETSKKLLSILAENKRLNLLEPIFSIYQGLLEQHKKQKTVEAFVASLSHIPLLSIGFNCALGADLLLPYMKRLSNITEFHTSAHPNAGLPNAFGEYDQTPEEMRDLIKEYLESKSVNIIGGCCGTTPKHIKLIAQEANNFSPRNLIIDE